MTSSPKRARRWTSALLACVLACAGLAFAQSGDMPLVQVTPGQLQFATMYNGTQQANVVGDVTKPGPYAVRIRFPAGLRIQPHFHPEARIVLVMSGTLYVAYGDTFDEARLVAMPAGSVFTEPGGKAHFTWAKDGAVELHVTGTGPTNTTWVKTGGAR